MSGDELMKLVIADSVYGLAGVLVLYTLLARDAIRQRVGVLFTLTDILVQDVLIRW